jgi:hypothetical protein
MAPVDLLTEKKSRSFFNCRYVVVSFAVRYAELNEEEAIAINPTRTAPGYIFRHNSSRDDRVQQAARTAGLGFGSRVIYLFAAPLVEIFLETRLLSRHGLAVARAIGEIWFPGQQ